MSYVEDIGLCCMPNLKSFSVPGVTLWFYSDDHEPPHFHAKRKGKWEIRVRFLEEGEAMFDLKWRKSAKTVVSNQDKKDLAKQVQKHRLEILREWERKVKHQ